MRTLYMPRTLLVCFPFKELKDWDDNVCLHLVGAIVLPVTKVIEEKE